MRHWIGCTGSNTHPLGLRPEIASQGYSWLHNQTLASIGEGLEPVWHCPLGCALGSVVATSCGPALGQLFKDLMAATEYMNSYAVPPALFVGMRSHDPCAMRVPNDSRYIDVDLATDRGVVEDNIRYWANVGCRLWIVDNGSAARALLKKMRDHVRSVYGMEVHGEGLVFNPDMTVDDTIESVHTDYIMARSHPDLHNNAAGTGTVLVQWGPGKTKQQVIDSMTHWRSRGFKIDYQGTLDADVLAAWRSVSQA